MVARYLNSFRKGYQTCHPIVPFLITDIAFIYRNLLALFIRKYMLEEATGIVNPLTTNVPHHIETSQLICTANQLTGF